ncbi:hypothetical protein ACFL2S_04140 [Thermodesulfobacteriota bacterium]
MTDYRGQMTEAFDAEVGMRPATSYIRPELMSKAVKSNAEKEMDECLILIY